MDAPQQNFISNLGKQARIVRDTHALSQELDTLFNGTPDYASSITQEQIDSVPAFAAAGLTVAQVASVVYTLKMINIQMDTIDFAAFIVLANLT